MPGWTQIGSREYSSGGYGNWSDWSDYEPTGSSTRKVETKTQYQSREKTWKQSSSMDVEGYTFSHKEEKAGSWSDWSESQMSESETESRKVEVEKEQRQKREQTGTEYFYSRWMFKDPTQGGKLVSSYSTEEKWIKKADPGAYYEETGWGAQKPCGGTYDGYPYYGSSGYVWWHEQSRPVYSEQSYTVYRSRTVDYTYHFYKWNDWSDWTDTKISSGEDREVNTRTMYRYADKTSYYEYTYERWTDPSSWSDTPVTGSGTRRVNRQTVYKYRDKVSTATYYYYQWSDWSDYRDEKAYASSTREVQTRTVYRYKEK